MRPFKLLPLLLLLATAAFAANWAGEVTTPTTTETIDGKKFYVITNAAELAGFAAMESPHIAGPVGEVGNLYGFGLGIVDAGTIKLVGDAAGGKQADECECRQREGEMFNRVHIV